MIYAELWNDRNEGGSRKLEVAEGGTSKEWIQDTCGCVAVTSGRPAIADDTIFLVLFWEIFGSISGFLKQYLHLMFIKSRLLVAVVTLSTSHHVTMFFCRSRT